MGMKEWYMDRMMKKMTPEERQNMMNTMMDKFFASMTKAEKKELMSTMMPKMMENMFKGMSNEDKQELMMTMMPLMMENMFGGSGSSGGGGMMGMMPQMMAMMFGGGQNQQKSKGIGTKTEGSKKEKGIKTAQPVEDFPMMDMMKMCMGEGEHKPPWVSMENAFNRAMAATEYSMLSTEEINTLFQDWLSNTNEKVLTLTKENLEPPEIAKKLNLSEKSVHFIICKLAQDGKLGLQIVNKT